MCLSGHQWALERNLRLNFNKNTLHDRIYRIQHPYNPMTSVRSFSIFRVQVSHKARQIVSITVNFDFFFRGDALVDEEPKDIASVISLQLDNVTPLGVLGCRSIATPRLFKVARQFFHVQIVGQTTHRGQALTSISFLKVQMHKIVTGYLTFLTTSNTTSRVSGGVERVVVIQDEYLVLGLGIFTHIAVSFSHRLVLSRCHIPTNKLIYQQLKTHSLSEDY